MKPVVIDSHVPSKKIAKVMMFGVGQVAVFDEQGHQIPELQVSMVHLWCENAVKEGFNPEGIRIDHQSGYVTEIFKTTEGHWNQKVIFPSGMPMHPQPKGS